LLIISPNLSLLLTVWSLKRLSAAASAMTSSSLFVSSSLLLCNGIVSKCFNLKVAREVAPPRNRILSLLRNLHLRSPNNSDITFQILHFVISRHQLIGLHREELFIFIFIFLSISGRKIISIIIFVKLALLRTVSKSVPPIRIKTTHLGHGCIDFEFQNEDCS
jgi:hypothetical protein